MRRSVMTRLVGTAVLVLSLSVGFSTTSAAAEETRTLNFPANTACSFAVTIVVTGSNSVTNDFYDKNGNLSRMILAGTGPAYTFTNTNTGKTLSTPARGSTRHVTVYPDGSVKIALTGHDLIILFPDADPAGPSTTLYNGRVVFTEDVDGVKTLLKVSGPSTDVCAAIS